ncbi:MAG: class I SAM-dependent methyltransferase [Actinobacteria bacterium]|nr:class I SAM-dependent methyltransferase [Actinomycetota bacterium]
MTDTTDLDQVLEEVRAAAEAARASGVYPEGLEEALQSDFARQLRRPDPRERILHLRHELDRLNAADHFRRASAPTTSSVPGGSAAHKAVAKVVGRQIEGLSDRMQEFSQDLLPVISHVVDGLQDPRSHIHDDIVHELDSMQDRVAGLQSTLDRLGVTFSETASVMARMLDHLNELDGIGARLDRLEEAERRRGFDPFFDYGAFEDVARGSSEGIALEYGDLADRLAASPGPVLDIGAGRGEFLQLMADRGTTCWGIEIDEQLVRAGREAGLDVRLGDGVEALREASFGSLGAIVLLHVIEHLTVNELMELVQLSRDRLAPGGFLVMETPNPQSLYVFARAFWLDPTHSKPVHPVYLEFMLRQAGYDHVEYDWTAAPDESEQLILPDDDSPLAAVVAENARRVNALVFGAQNYRVVAIR